MKEMSKDVELLKIKHQIIIIIIINDLQVAHPHVVLRLPDSWSNWNLEMLVFEERRKPEYHEKNLSEQWREPTTNSTHMYMVSTPGFEPGPHWWEASALTTAPPLLPN